nr:MAG TPA: hypothetical protein [Caudoviricetes sp.]
MRPLGGLWRPWTPPSATWTSPALKSCETPSWRPSRP